MQGQNNCDFFRTQIFDYVSDTLSDSEKVTFLSHVDICPVCKQELLKVEAITSATSALPEIEVPDGLYESVSSKIAQLADTPKSNKIYFIRRFASVVVPLAACAALAIGVYSNGLLYKFTGSDDILSPPINHREVNYDEPPTPESSAHGVETTLPKVPDVPANAARVITNHTAGDNSTAQNTTPEDFSTEESPMPPPSARTSVQNNEDTDISVAEYSLTDDANQTPAAYHEGMASFPARCTIVTTNIEAFSARFDADILDGKINIDIPFDNINSLMEFAADYGVEINFEYSTEQSDTISVTVLIKE